MDNTVGNENISHNNTSRVHINAAVDDADGEVGSVDGLESGVGEHGAVAHGALDDVVGEDGGGLLQCQVGGGRADGCECCVGRSWVLC